MPIDILFIVNLVDFSLYKSSKEIFNKFFFKLLLFSLFRLFLWIFIYTNSFRFFSLLFYYCFRSSSERKTSTRTRLPWKKWQSLSRDFSEAVVPHRRTVVHRMDRNCLLMKVVEMAVFQRICEQLRQWIISHRISTIQRN